MVLEFGGMGLWHWHGNRPKAAPKSESPQPYLSLTSSVHLPTRAVLGMGARIVLFRLFQLYGIKYKALFSAVPKKRKRLSAHFDQRLHVAS